MSPVEIILYLTIFTGTGKQDIHFNITMPDIKACVEEADKFLRHKFPDSVDAKRLTASCSVEQPQEDPS